MINPKNKKIVKSGQKIRKSQQNLKKSQKFTLFNFLFYFILFFCQKNAILLAFQY